MTDSNERDDRPPARTISIVSPRYYLPTLILLLVLTPVVLTILAWSTHGARDRVGVAGIGVIAAVAILSYVHGHWYEPYRLEVYDDQTLAFRGRLRTTRLRASDVASIERLVRDRGGPRIFVIYRKGRYDIGRLRIPGLSEECSHLIRELQALNPSIEFREA